MKRSSGSDDDIKQLSELLHDGDSEKLDVIYNVVPQHIHFVWASTFEKKHRDFAEAVQTEFVERYTALHSQHEIARMLFSRCYLRMIRLAQSLKYSVDQLLSWDNVRSRLSQDNTTFGKNWLEKLHSIST